MKISLCLKTDGNLNIRNQNNKIIVPKELKLFLLTVHVFNEMCIAASNRVEYSEKERE
jgi:hypothetical protein